MTATTSSPAGHSAASAIPPKSNKAQPEEKQKNPPPAHLPSPKLRLQAKDLTHPSTTTFLTLFPDLHAVINTALSAIVAQLYTSPHGHEHPSPHGPHHGHPCPTAPPVHFHPRIPGTRSVTFILHAFSGVAYTTSIDLDTDHKEIHLSLTYISTVKKTNPDPRRELTGVLTHELVHCYQHTHPRDPHHPNQPSHTPRPPSGLIEGIADFVRLKASLAPPHWKRPTRASDRPPRWDAGYQHTAYFLEWIEDVKVGKGAVGMLNDRLRITGYIGEGEGEEAKKGCGKDGFWVGLFGLGVLELWDEYGIYLDGLGGGKK